MDQSEFYKSYVQHALSKKSSQSFQFDKGINNSVCMILTCMFNRQKVYKQIYLTKFMFLQGPHLISQTREYDDEEDDDQDYDFQASKDDDDNKEDDDGQKEDNEDDDDEEEED